MKIWLIGKRGMLSSSFQKLLSENNFSFVVTGSDEVDITSKLAIDLFLKRESFSHVLNCSAYTNVDGAEQAENREIAFKINRDAVCNLVSFSQIYSFKIIHFSTDYIFDGQKRAPYGEEERGSPLSIYGRSKWEGERQIIDNLENFLIIRTSWLFGFNKRNFVLRLLDNLMKSERVTIVDDQIGRPTFSDDLARGALSIILREQKGIFHFTNDLTLSWFEFAKLILERALQNKITLRCKEISPISSLQFNSLAKRPGYSVLDTTKAEKLLNLKMPSLETALDYYLRVEYGS